MHAFFSGIRVAAFLLLVLLLVNPSSAFAVGFARVGTFGFIWEGLYTGARQSSMGSADMAGAQGPSGLFLNTALLPSTDGVEVEYGRSPFVNGIDIEILGAAVAWKGWRFGFSRQQMLMDPVIVRTAFAPEGTGEVIEATAGEAMQSTPQTQPKKLMQEGHYKEALEIYKKLVVDPAHLGAEAGEDLSAAKACMDQLGRPDGWDDLACGQGVAG